MMLQNWQGNKVRTEWIPGTVLLISDELAVQVPSAPCQHFRLS